MTRIFVVAAMSAIVAGCGTPGVAYRGAPPAGMTDAEYRCKLVGTGCPQRQMWPDMKDRDSNPNA